MEDQTESASAVWTAHIQLLSSLEQWLVRIDEITA